MKILLNLFLYGTIPLNQLRFIGSLLGIQKQIGCFPQIADKLPLYPQTYYVQINKCLA